MIAPTVMRDIVSRANDAVFNYGDKILEVGGESLPHSTSPVIDALRKLPPSGIVQLKVLREGKLLTLSAACSDSLPVQSLLDDGLVSATRGDLLTCAEKLSAAQQLHELAWPLAYVLFECRQRTKTLPTSEAQALYEVDRQAILESATWPEKLEKFRAAMLADAETLRRLGASDLASRISSEFEVARTRVTSTPTSNGETPAEPSPARATPERVAAVDPALTLADLTAAAQVVRAYKPRDQFDSPPKQQAFVGRIFELNLTPRETGFDRGCGAFPTWRYEAPKGELEISAAPGFVFGGDVRPAGALPVPDTVQVNSLSFACQRTAQSPAQATNGFGAVTTVRRSLEESLSISTADLSTNEPYLTAKLDGPAARDLVKAARVRITGALGEWRPGQVIVCYSDKHEATFELPFERTVRDCMFNTTWIKFELVDQRTQAVLRAWESGAPPSATSARGTIEPMLKREIESWGPRSTALTKQALAALGFYTGPLDDRKDPALYDAVQTFHLDYVRKCNAGQIHNGPTCEARRWMSRPGLAHSLPPISSEIYDLAPEQLRAALGSLKVGD